MSFVESIQILNNLFLLGQLDDSCGHRNCSGNSYMKEILKGSSIKLQFTRADVNPSFEGLKPEPVIEYLDHQASVHQYFAGVVSLVDASVNAYQRRRFKNLMVSFGCTGGQHRSVYCAETLAQSLRGREGIAVERVSIHSSDLDDVFLAVTGSRVAAGIGEPDESAMAQGAAAR